MIKVCDDCEYTVLIADLIETLASLDEFRLKMWVNGNEIPYTFHSGMADFEFLQEGLKISNKENIQYLFYDTLISIMVMIL